ncbi:LPXTG cell wall anchor domain-containing protein, partial [Macrococcoides caseolyticum]|uniref:LPXTG cell wall anchor domain-containing protein n=1 Tax=Macrococcoides caseolyticum TaxID=69966 RepID=UPI0022798656
FTPPTGYESSPVNTGDDRIDSDGTVVKVTVNNADDNTIDSGFYKPEGGGSTEPVKPGEPTTPVKPGEPTEPVKPGEPTTPSTPGVPTTNNTLTSLPDTGENNNTGLLATMLAGLGGLLLLKKRREENDDTEKEMK